MDQYCTNIVHSFECWDDFIVEFVTGDIEVDVEGVSINRVYDLICSIHPP